MALALGAPDLVSNIASVDNAPSDKSLGKGFADYVRGMKQIDAANCTRQAEADDILKKYEEVSQSQIQIPSGTNRRWGKGGTDGSVHRVFFLFIHAPMTLTRAARGTFRII